MRSSYLFTSESVSEGHPDKVADQISDAIVDLFLGKDPEARIACETLVTTQRIVVGGEIRCKGVFDLEQHPETHGWAPDRAMKSNRSCATRSARSAMSRRAFTGRPPSLKTTSTASRRRSLRASTPPATRTKAPATRASCSVTPPTRPRLPPATLYYSHKILERMAADRHSGAAPFLEPDAKSQVTLRYEESKPVAATAIVVSTQHAKGYHEGAQEAELKAYVKAVVADILPAHLLSDETVYHINPTGAFEIGGPDGDAGLTGRKIIVDTYGGAAPHGGGAFSGKDPTKVDRSAAYMARYLAKNIVAAGFATRCTIQLAYAIGVSEPLSLYVDSHGTGDGRRRPARTGDPRHREARPPDPARHSHPPGAQQADLLPDRRLRPLRPQGRG